MTKLEEMARALSQELGNDPDSTWGGLRFGSNEGSPNWLGFVSLVRAPLLVLREPNAAMAAAIGRAIGTDERAIVLSVWYALIDTVLEEKP